MFETSEQGFMDANHMYRGHDSLSLVSPRDLGSSDPAVPKLGMKHFLCKIARAFCSRKTSAFSCSASGPSGTLTFKFPEGQDLRDPIILSLRADESDPCRLATCQRIKNTAPNYHGLCNPIMSTVKWEGRSNNLSASHT